jgi:hypothetical protein
MNMPVKTRLYEGKCEESLYEVFENAGLEDHTSTGLHKEKRLQQEWCKLRPLGKLQNIILSIKKTPHWCDEWRTTIVLLLQPDSMA